MDINDIYLYVGVYVGFSWYFNIYVYIFNVFEFLNYMNIL